MSSLQQHRPYRHRAARYSATALSSGMDQRPRCTPPGAATWLQRQRAVAADPAAPHDL